MLEMYQIIDQTLRKNVFYYFCSKFQIIFMSNQIHEMLIYERRLLAYEMIVPTGYKVNNTLEETQIL